MVTKEHRVSGELARREAELFKAIGHPIRVRILHLLAAGPASVQQITDAVGAGRPNVSRHLAVLKAAGILRDRKDGLNVRYSLIAPCILEVFACCNRAIRQQLQAGVRALRELR